MVNPFDLKSVLLARHAQHVVLVHFPIALFMTGVGLDLLSRGRRNSELAAAAYLNLCIAAAAVVPTVFTGLLAWQFVLDGHRLKGVLLLHFVAALFATFLVLATWWIHWYCRRGEAVCRLFLPGYRLPIEVVGVVLIAVTAHLGGFLSGVNP